jgi:hypothetical protein
MGSPITHPGGLVDPIADEKVRRAPHEYRHVDGVHGRYVPKPYQHQEYPKMMLQAPRPQFKDFKRKLLAANSKSELEGLLLGSKLDLESLYQAACIEWDEAAQASIVKNKAEEEAWLAENANPEFGAITESVKEKAAEIKAKREEAVEANPVTAVAKPGTPGLAEGRKARPARVVGA